MSLQVWLPLDGSLENRGLANVSVTNNGATVDNNGKIGKCYSFKGSNNWIGITKGLPSSSTNLSVCTWIKVNSLTSTQTIYTQRVAVGDGLSIFLGSGGTNLLFDVVGSSDRWTIPAQLDTTQWHHIAITYDKKEKKYYLDGQLVDATGCTLTPKLATNATIGMSQVSDSTTDVSSNSLNGKLNDFRIYNHALSAREVKEIAQAKVLHYPLGATPLNNLEFYTYSDGSKWIKLLHHNVNNGTTLFTSKNAGWCNNPDTYSRLNLLKNFKPKSNGTYEFLVYQSDDGIWRRWSQTNNPLTTTEVTGYTQISTANPGGGICKCSSSTYIARTSTSSNWWNALGAYSTHQGGIPGFNLVVKGVLDFYISADSLNATDFTDLEYDISGYNHHGTIQGNIQVDSNSKRYSTSYKFTSSSIITASNMTKTYDAITVNIWGYKSSWNTSSAERLFGSATGGSGFCIGDYGTENTIFGCYMNGSYNTYPGFKQLSNGWHMFTIVTNGNTLNYYIDGSLVKTITFSTKQTLSINYDIVLGCHYGGTHHFTGNLSDARIYATALSASDIQELYNLGREE